MAFTGGGNLAGVTALKPVKLIRIIITALLSATPPTAAAEEPLPAAISCYQTAANAEDIDAYIDCFTPDAEMLDVSRVFNGADAIRAWALREVIPSGDAFRHRRILESAPGYAKTEVQWLSWVAHYHYWWNATGKITKMSLQYAD